MKEAWKELKSLTKELKGINYNILNININDQGIFVVLDSGIGNIAKELKLNLKTINSQMVKERYGVAVYYNKTVRILESELDFIKEYKDEDALEQAIENHKYGKRALTMSDLKKERL